MTEKCIEKTTQGTSCQAYAQTDSPYCFIHDPAQAFRRRQALKLGGKHSRKVKGQTFLSPYNVTTIKGLLDGIAALIVETSRLSHSVKRDQAIGQLIKVQSHLIVQYKEELSAANLNRRMRELFPDGVQKLHQANLSRAFNQKMRLR